MNSRRKPFHNLKFEPTFLLQVQADLKRLYSSIHSNQVKGMEIKKIDEIGFLISLSSISKNDFPHLYEFINIKFLKSIMNKSFIRILYTDPKQFDPDTPTKKLDRYFPHVDRNDQERSPAGSINIAIENCDQNTVTNWHIIDNQNTNIVKFEWVHILYEESMDTIFESYSMKESDCILIRTDTFHSVKNNGSKKRVIAAWHTEADIDWDSVVKHFENILIE